MALARKLNRRESPALSPRRAERSLHLNANCAFLFT